MNGLDYVVNKVLSILRADIMKNTGSGDLVGTVIRTEGNTAWVHFDGGVDETPVAKTINCEKGDKVRVRNTNGTPFIVGNDSAPPTDDTKANEANDIAMEAANIAVEAQNDAESIRQYFWFLDGDSSEAGAHVTEIPIGDFLKNPRGGNLLLRSNSVRIRVGVQILSELTDNRVTLASGKAVVKYSEDGSAFGLQDSHRIVVCKGTDELGVRNDATLSSRDVTGFNMNTMPMAFFNATHKNDNGTKTAAAGQYVFDGEGHVYFAVLSEDGTLEVYNEIRCNNVTWSGMNTAINNAAGDIAELQDELDALPGRFVKEHYALTLSSSALNPGGHLEYSVTKTKAGYVPLGVVGFHSDKQATTVRSCYIDETGEGTCKVHMHIRNDSSDPAAANITGSVDVMWMPL